jgi:hypothetical protein
MHISFAFGYVACICMSYQKVELVVVSPGSNECGRCAQSASLIRGTVFANFFIVLLNRAELPGKLLYLLYLQTIKLVAWFERGRHAGCTFARAIP